LSGIAGRCVVVEAGKNSCGRRYKW